MLRKILVAAFGAAVLLAVGPAVAAPESERWPLWEPFDAESAVRVDHGAWTRLLQAHVVPSEDGVNRVDYQGFDGAALDAYLAEVTAIDPRTLTRAEQMAYWINLYNALTVQVVLDNPKKGSILRMGGFFSIGPWDREVAQVAGVAVTLNDIEHRILRPIWQDERIHYAVNCASIGCPNLAREAYTADKLDAQLNAAEAGYLGHARGIQIDDRGRLVLSTIFEWYLSDFAPDEAGLLAHLAERYPARADALSRYEGRIRYDYDWTLNSVNPR